MRTGRGLLVTTLVLVIGASVLGFTATKTGLIDRLDAVYSSWSLNSRIEGLWDARIAGDLDKARGFISDERDQVRLGTSVQYFSYEIKEVIVEEDQATVILDIEYKLTVPGFFSEADSPVKTESIQHWVRNGKTWYWEPGSTLDKDEDTPDPTTEEPTTEDIEENSASTPED